MTAALLPRVSAPKGKVRTGDSAITLTEMRKDVTPATYKVGKQPLADKLLRHAVFKGDVSEVKRVLKRGGADIEAADQDGYTPLLIAVRWDRLAMVRVRRNRATHLREVSVENR